MKTNIIALVIKVIIVIFYQNMIKSNIFSIKKLVTQIKIIVYNENLVIQIQIVNVTRIYSQL